MGYTHYWSINPNDPTLIAAWPQLSSPTPGARPLVADLFGTDQPALDFEVDSTKGPQAVWGVTA